MELPLTVLAIVFLAAGIALIVGAKLAGEKFFPTPEEPAPPKPEPKLEKENEFTKPEADGISTAAKNIADRLR